MCVCVCVCVRERERERERQKAFESVEVVCMTKLCLYDVQNHHQFNVPNISGTAIQVDVICGCKYIAPNFGYILATIMTETNNTNVSLALYNPMHVVSSLLLRMNFRRTTANNVDKYDGGGNDSDDNDDNFLIPNTSSIDWCCCCCLATNVERSVDRDLMTFC